MQGGQHRPSPNKAHSILTLFQAAKKKNKPSTKQNDSDKMATTEQQAPESMKTEVITKEVYQKLIKRFDDPEKGLINKFIGLLKPLTDGLEKMNVSLLQVSNVVEETKTIMLKQQSDIVNFYNSDDKISEQLVTLSNKTRFFLNLKLRGGGAGIGRRQHRINCLYISMACKCSKLGGRYCTKPDASL